MQNSNDENVGESTLTEKILKLTDDIIALAEAVSPPPVKLIRYLKRFKKEYVRDVGN